jgi:formylglycine-generating enzyme required for sulfatase activity
MRRLLVLAALLVALPAGAVTIDWVAVGNPSNAADTPSTNCYAANCGSVAYSYFISKYEVTNAQYAEFMNAVDAGGSNTLALYNASMDTDATLGGISFVVGNAAGSKYVVKAGFENKPVVYVSFWDALRFANWLNNGQAAASTEIGSYTITAGGIAANSITRNSGAITFLTSENEWYKAAYYSPGGTYFDYPAGSNSAVSCVAPVSDTGNSASCESAVGALTDVGSYSLSDSPFGTFDQGGNVFEWNEQVVSGGALPPSAYRGIRGGSWPGDGASLAASNRQFDPAENENGFAGFRVASLVPEPGTGVLVMAGLLGLAARRKKRP